MQGISVQGHRPKTKKALALMVATIPHDVKLEATSILGNEYAGPITEAPAGRFDVVGPDPYTSRKWYANIYVTVGDDGSRSFKVK